MHQAMSRSCRSQRLSAARLLAVLRRRVAKSTGATIVVTLADMDGNEAFEASSLGSADEVHLHPCLRCSSACEVTVCVIACLYPMLRVKLTPVGQDAVLSAVLFFLQSPLLSAHNHVGLPPCCTRKSCSGACNLQMQTGITMFCVFAANESAIMLVRSSPVSEAVEAALQLCRHTIVCLGAA